MLPTGLTQKKIGFSTVSDPCSFGVWLLFGYTQILLIDSNRATICPHSHTHLLLFCCSVAAVADELVMDDEV